VQSGKLRHRLEIQIPTEVRDDIGGTRYDWLPLTTVWGSVEPLKARELFEAAKIEARLSHRITTRFYPSFSQQWRLRLVNTTRIFNVHSARNVEERQRMLEILALEIVEEPRATA
jgi:SPP1 family predicted phage head-tail adaptor